MFDWAHIHVMINHLPIIGLPITAAVLALGMAQRSRDLVLAATVLAVVIGGSSFAVKQTGEWAEEVVEDLAWANHDVIHDHEEAGEKATIAALVAALTAAVIGWRARGQAVLTLGGPALLLILLLATSGLMAWTGLEGGEIRHDEFGALRPSAGLPAP
jgi:hypothetical protein